MIKRIGVVITSCGRLDLLDRTIKSFEENNKYPFEVKIIMEDSQDPSVMFHLSKEYGPQTKYGYTIIQNFKKSKDIIGQFYSIDRGYEICEANDCEYVFHLEDDWEFQNGDCIEISIRFLDFNPKVFSVNVRELDKNKFSINGHRLIKNPLEDIMNPFYLFQKNHEGWDGFSLNPGLRRIADYKLCAPYAQFKSEKEINDAYKKYNFDYAVLPGYCKHIGDSRSVREY